MNIKWEWNLSLTLSQTKNLVSSKLKEFADDNFKHDVYGRLKFSYSVENAVGKGEIARFQQCFLFPQCFQKICTADTLTQEFVWEMVKRIDIILGTYIFSFSCRLCNQHFSFSNIFRKKKYFCS